MFLVTVQPNKNWIIEKAVYASLPHYSLYSRSVFKKKTINIFQTMYKVFNLAYISESFNDNLKYRLEMIDRI